MELQPEHLNYDLLNPPELDAELGLNLLGKGFLLATAITLRTFELDVKELTKGLALLTKVRYPRLALSSCLR